MFLFMFQEGIHIDHYTLFLFYFFTVGGGGVELNIKGTLTSKMKILSLFTHPISFLYAL